MNTRCFLFGHLSTHDYVSVPNARTTNFPRRSSGLWIGLLKTGAGVLIERTATTERPAPLPAALAGESSDFREFYSGRFRNLVVRDPMAVLGVGSMATGFEEPIG